ncbi:transposase, partial [Desulfosporosinus sp. BICA1-9]|uniref:transposase n=1 Tax=Desulfosporosinus sp. BICA1-9 TaxID=1531958 RepID=UPI00054C8078
MIQLDMFSPLYYSTLGFDDELIDYMTFIKDDQIRNLFPRKIVDPRGRKPWDAVVLFRMHILYFTRPEFVSFRQMCKELSKAKHQDYRNFLGITGTKVPSHVALSRFRKLLSINDNTINELSKPFLSQAEKMEGFLNLMISALDSRPIFAAVGGFKKECTCKTPEKCTCPPRFSDKD